jgi:hypothetical protein
MTQPTVQTRSYRVQVRDDGGRHARTVQEASFEAAAVAYAEDLHGAPNYGAGDADEVSLIVRDLETGHEHCFRVDLASGETAACG